MAKNKAQPLEYLAITSVLLSCIFAVIFNLKFYSPSISSATFAFQNYILATLISYSFLTFNTKSNILQNTIKSTKHLLSITIIIYIHFNFKLWSSLINNRKFDKIYNNFENLFPSFIDIITFINIGFSPLKQLIPNAYHCIFVIIFIVSLFIHGLQRK